MLSATPAHFRLSLRGICSSLLRHVGAGVGVVILTRVSHGYAALRGADSGPRGRNTYPINRTAEQAKAAPTAHLRCGLWNH